MENWKDIKGYEGLYMVSDQGRVRSLPRATTKGRILKPIKLRDGYLYVVLSKNGKHKRMAIHRLVALVFISNPDNKPQVNHKSEVKTQNNVENLEWVTPSENINYGTRNERDSKNKINGKGSKQVIQTTLDNTIIKIWPSASEAGRNGFNLGNIVLCCQGKEKQQVVIFGGINKKRGLV